MKIYGIRRCMKRIRIIYYLFCTFDFQANICDDVFDVLYYFMHMDDKESSLFALKSIGNICIRHYEYMMQPTLRNHYQYILREDNMAVNMKVQVSRNSFNICKKNKNNSRSIVFAQGHLPYMFLPCAFLLCIENIVFYEINSVRYSIDIDQGGGRQLLFQPVIVFNIRLPFKKKLCMWPKASSRITELMCILFLLTFLC